MPTKANQSNIWTSKHPWQAKKLLHSTLLIGVIEWVCVEYQLQCAYQENLVSMNTLKMKTVNFYVLPLIIFLNSFGVDQECNWVTALMVKYKKGG